LQTSLVTDRYIPDERAILSPKEWTQLNYGWCIVLEPHITDPFKKEVQMARQQPLKDLHREERALSANIRQIRGGQ
jgi:hypothetical protein